MKKKLEADLISIAHRILKLKNKSDINQLYLETQKLYEKLAVLKFVDDNFDAAKPTIGRSQMLVEIEEAFSNESVAITIPEEEETPVAEVVAIEEVMTTPLETTLEEPILLLPEIESEEIFETIASEPIKIEAETEVVQEEYKEIHETETDFASFSPAFEIDEEIEEEKEPEEIEEEEEAEEIEAPKVAAKPEAIQISFEDLMGINYSEAQFVKVEELDFIAPAKNSDFQEKKTETPVAVLEKTEPKTMSLNERLAKGIHIDLNDRLAFTKHLFGNSPEDYNRVLNQLITFNTFGETKQFIEDMVKPDYNNWDGKDDYSHRFMEILEKKFL